MSNLNNINETGGYVDMSLSPSTLQQPPAGINAAVYVDEMEFDKFGNIDEVARTISFDPVALGIAVRSEAGTLNNIASTTNLPTLEQHNQYFTSTTASKIGYILGETLNNNINIAHEHITRAAELREYYSSKFTMQKLKDIKLTQYQSEIFSICTRNTHTLKWREVALLCNIELMWEIDKFIDKIAADNTLVSADQAVADSIMLGQFELEIIDGAKSLGKTSELLFFRDQNDHLISIRTTKNESLNSLLIDYISKNKYIRVDSDCKIACRVDRDLNYLQLYDPILSVM